MCKLRVLIIFLLGMTCVGYAQLNHFEFLTNKEGLSNNSVNSFYEDEYARMWVATRNGLNCYDGGSFRVWGARDGLNDTYIRNVVGDQNGNLLIQTRTNIFRMDLHNEQLSPVRHASNVSTIAGNTYGLWIASEDTLFSVDIADSISLSPILTASGITSVLVPNKHRLWVASSDGVRLYEEGRPTSCFPQIHHVSRLYEDSQRRLWICTRDSGLYLCSQTQVIAHYTQGDSSASLTDNDVRCITEDHTGSYWIGLYGGLCRLDMKSNTIHRYEYSPRVEHALSAFSVWALTTDSQGTIWIGTFFGGIDLINPQYSPYTYWGSMGRDGYRLSNPIVTCVSADNEGNLWIGTNGEGVNHLNRTTNHIDYYNLNTSSPQYAVKTMWFDSESVRLWVGTHRGGLQWLNVNSSKPSFHTVSLPEANIRKLFPKGDSIVVLTQHNIYIISRQTGEYRQFVPPDIMPVIKGELSDMVLYDGCVWFARATSLYAYPYAQSNFVGLRQYELPTNVVTLFADSLNGLLIGTDNSGILQKQDSSFMPVASLNDVMTSPYIMDIAAGDSSYVFATDYRVYISDRHLANCHSLFSSDKLPIETIVEHCCPVIGSEVCVGGVNGMMIVPLKETNNILTPISLRITRLQIDNNPEPDPQLSNATITLKPDNRVLSMVISATGAITSNDYRIRFRMKGYEEDWTDTHNNAKLSYANLPSGTYKLEAECIGTNLRCSVRVRVLPPWYASWWALLVYILAGLGLLIWGIRSFASYIERRTKRQLSKAHQQDLQKATVVVMNHLADSEFNVESFAREMLLSRTGLFTKMQDISGQTPNDFIVGIRMREAAKMLRTQPELSILDVSILVGFNSCSYFTKCFHKQYGVSPSTWRKAKV